MSKKQAKRHDTMIQPLDYKTGIANQHGQWQQSCSFYY